MDFVDFGGLAAFLHIKGTFSRLSSVVFIWSKKIEAQTAEIIRETAIAHWMGVFGKPAIFIVDKDARFGGEIIQDIARKVTFPYKGYSVISSQSRGH